MKSSRRVARVAVSGVTLVALFTAGLFLSIGAPDATAVGPCDPPVVNPVACENTLPGTPPNDWQIVGDGDMTIAGFATQMSVNKGATVVFKIKTPASSYHIDVLRLGYYQGNGARKVAANITPTASLPQTQPACLAAATTGLIDCGNWTASASWAVPASAVSGVYVAHLVRNDTGGSNQIVFVVRDDASHSDVVFQTSDTTWQAYNTYGGNSLYTCATNCPAGDPGGYKGASKVSYNRPATPSADLGRASIYSAEFAMLRFLEANGYDMTYMAGIDVNSRGPLLQNHKVFVSSGHDEYWSGQQRANVEAARDAGVSLAFFSGNEVFWKTRWESSIDTSATAGRTLVAYKDTHYNASVDPVAWTGTWADPRFSPPGDGGNPPNALTGQYFVVNAGTSDIQVPSQYAALRLWRNTAAAALAPGQTLTLGAGIGTLGYEWDADVDNGFRPAGLFHLSSRTVNVPEAFVTDWGTVVTPATVTHHLTLYRVASGALVFGAGTVQWSWGLDSEHPGGHAPDRNMQQATVNLFADMGAQPTSLLPGLVGAGQSTDTTRPTSTVTSPANGATLQDGAQVTVTGTAADTGGGVVAGVEVSTDGGGRWHPATGTNNWSYSWVVHGNPIATLLSRAIDDSGNVENPTGTTVNVSCPCSLWGSSATPALVDAGDPGAVELGVKFTSDAFGTVSGIRFYKASANTGTHVGNLWTSTGQLLATATFISESASGWQQVNFATPVVVSANTTYVASYFAPRGHYSATDNYFYNVPPSPNASTSLDNPPLHAVRHTAGSPNGVFTYGATSTFPSSADNGTNYWVDVVYAPSSPPGQVTGVSATAGYTSATVTWNAPSTGGAVTTYTVTPFVGSTAQTPVTVTGSPAPTGKTVTGLTNGTTYTFRVTASNPLGTGAVSAPSNAVTPSASASVVINGGFEGGLSPWVSGGTVAPSASTARAHSGAGSALLGTLTGAPPGGGGDSSVSQTVTVPPSATLSFWYWRASVDQICSGAACIYDWQEAQVRSTGGATLASVFKSNANAPAWTQVTYDMSAFAGQTVVLWFNVRQDATPDPTSMYLDDVSLSGSAPAAPAAPTGVVASAGNASASVSWTAPANGGSPITGYTVTPFVGSTPQTPVTVSGNPPATSVTVGGLTNGTAYTFTVTATNAIGTGAPSAPSSAVTPSAPTAPLAPTGVVASAGNASASVSWTAPANGGSPITGYTVTPFVGSTPQTPVTVSGNPPATSVTVGGLTNGTAYTFTVTATNAIGTGAPSAASSAVTPGTASPPLVDVTVNVNGLGAQTTAAFSTAGAARWLFAFVRSDGSTTAGSQSATVSGAGLSWTLVRRTTAQRGTAEVWAASAPATLTNVTVTSTLQASNFRQALTVVAFANSTGPGASASNSAATGAPTVSLTTTQANSLVYAAGNDWTRAVARTVPANQTMVNQIIDSSAASTFWVQRLTAAVAASGTVVTINDTAPTNDRWNYTAVEIKGGVVATAAPTSTVVARTAGPSPSVFGESVTFSATVSSGSGTPTGTVQFKDGAVNLGAPVAMVAGAASLPTSGLAVGSHSITGVYSGDASFATSTSVAVTQTVNKATTATAITADAPDPSNVGQAFTVQWSVTVSAPGAGTPTGNVTVSDGTVSCSGTVAAGSCSLTSTTSGVKTLTATYAGDTNFATSAGTTDHIVNVAAPTATVVARTAGSTPSVFGESVTFTATVSSGSGTPTGTVQFKDGAANVGAPVAMVAGDADLVTAGLAVGSHSITGVYSGDALFATSTSAAVTQTVAKASTATAITSDAPDPSSAGQGYVVQWSVSVVAPGAGTPTGNVTVSDGTDTCTAAVAAGQCSLISTTAGAKTLTATYAGDASFATSAGTTDHTVNAVAPTATVVARTAGPDPSVFGESVTFSATVSSGSGTPTGTMQFKDGAANVGAPVALVDGAADLVTAGLAVGSHSLTGVYSGDPNFSTSTSPALTHTVAKASTATVITGDTPDPSSVGQAYLVQWSVSVTAPGAGTPTGNVTVSDGATSCTAAVAAGQCSLTSTATGVKTLTATYAGDASFATSAGTTGHTATAPALAVDTSVSVNGTSAQTTAPFSTSGTGRWVLAFIEADGPAATAAQTMTASGAGLTWSLVRRTNVQFGTSEVWAALAPAALTNVTVTSTPLVGGFRQAMTVVTFAGSSGVGASASANGATGAPTVLLTTTQANSLVYTAGNDWDGAVARTVPTNQTMVNQVIESSVGDTFWTQRLTAAVASPGLVAINNTAPTNHMWNYTAVEIKSA